MYFDDFEIGMSRDIEPATIEKDKMIAFAKEYDNIPLHTDEEYAKKTPFGGLIAPGVMSFLAVWANYLKVDFYGDELIAGLSTKMEWFKPVYAGDVLTGKAEITDLVRRNPRNGLVELTIEVFNQNGDLVIKDVTESVVKCREE
jgi:acyl dehydratase